MATIGKRIDAEDEVEQLKAILAEQQRRIDLLEQRLPTDGGKAKAEQRTTRRQLLKLAGATLAGAAGSAALGTIPASANNGNNVVIGSANTQDLSNTTSLSTTGAAAPGTVFSVNAFNVGNLTTIAGNTATGGTGVYGSTYSGIGVYGYGYASSSRGGKFFGDIGVEGFGYSFYGASHLGVWGAGSSTGVLGQAVNGPGVKGIANSSAGQFAVYGYATNTGGLGLRANAPNGAGSYASGGLGFVSALFVGDGGIRTFALGAFPAVQAASIGGGPDAQLNGTGRLNMVSTITGGVGAPNLTPLAGTFEEAFAADGALWVSRASGSGKAAWRRLNAVRADSDDGTGTAYKPFRLLDTRSGKYNGAIVPADMGPFGVINSTVSKTFTVAGTGTLTQHIPLDANAIFGNLTVTNFTGSGWLTITPAGTAHAGSDPSTVNFGPGMQPAIANSFFCGLGTGASAGQVTVYVNLSTGSKINFIIDITGYSQ